jgi:Tat protein translocase TatB subunit
MPTSLGPLEILVILVVALIVLGPERLPKAARQVGKAVAEVRHWSGGIQDEVRNAFNTDAEPEAPASPPPAHPTPRVAYPDPLKLSPEVDAAPNTPDLPEGPSLN